MKLILLNFKAPAFIAYLDPLTGRHFRWRQFRERLPPISGLYSTINSEFVAFYWDGHRLVFRWSQVVIPIDEDDRCRIERFGRNRTFYLYKNGECVFRKSYKLGLPRILEVLLAQRDPAWREMGWEDDNLLDELERSLGDVRHYNISVKHWRHQTEVRLRMRKRSDGFR